MWLLPWLLVGSALFWAYGFYAGQLLPWHACVIHALIAALVFFAARALQPFIGQPLRRSRAVLWQSFWVMVLAIWNIAAYGNYVSRKNWGDPLSFALLWQFLRYDEYSVSELLGPQNVVRWLSWGTASVFLCKKIHGWASRRQSILPQIGKRVERALLILSIIAGGLFIWRFPGSLQEEPIVSFGFTAASFSDLNGMDAHRGIARFLDQEARRKYRATGARPKATVVVIVLDSLRADHLPFYAYPRNTAPFLMSLVETGQMQKVENAFSSCSESYCGIASILTSHPYHKISHDSLKLYELLRPLGYTVDLILSGEHENFAGLSKFYGASVSNKWTLTELAKMGRPTVLNDDSTVLAYLDQLAPYDGKPRFMFFFLMSTHVGGKRFKDFERFMPIPERAAELRNRWNLKYIKDDLTSGVGDATYFETIANHYDNGVVQGDWMVQQIFNQLREKQYLKDAILVVTSDHGDSLGEHHHVGHGYKLYNEDMRVPLLVWDSRAAARLENNRFASHVDIAPTIFSRLDLPPPPTWSGRSLYLPRQSFSSVHMTRRGQDVCAAALLGSENYLHKLIACRRDGKMVEELYELLQDPKETQNLLREPAGNAPAVKLVPRLRQQLYFYYGNVINSCKRFDCVDAGSH